jgi:hypothetical protein
MATSNRSIKADLNGLGRVLTKFYSCGAVSCAGISAICTALIRPYSRAHGTSQGCPATCLQWLSDW